MEKTKVVIRIKNSYSWLNTNNEELRTVLWKSLRFLDPNARNIRAYRQRKWDGYKEFFKRKTGRFLTGLLPEILFVCKHFNAEVSYIEDRDPVDVWTTDEIDLKFLDNHLENASQDTKDRWESLRDYQVDHVNSLIKNHRGTIFAPTSAGKTAMMVSAVRAMKEDVKILILVNKKSLCVQNYDALKEWGVHDVGMFNSENKSEERILISTYQSVKNIKNIEEFKVLIVDEVHDMMGKSCLSIYEKLINCCVRLCMSATPFTNASSDSILKYSVKGHFGPVFKTNSDAAEGGVVKTKKLMDKGTLSKVDIYFHQINEPDDIIYHTYADAVDDGIVDNIYFHEKVKDLALECEGRTLIVVQRISHGDQLKYLFPDVLCIQGKDNNDTRKAVINDLKFKKGNVIAIATTGIFNTGVSVYVHNLINAAGGKSEKNIIQRIGRGLRTAQDKEKCIYHDFMFNTNKYLNNHSKARIRILKKENHKVNIFED